MPKRFIVESLKTGPTANQMSDFEFRLWINLIVSADDFGRYYAEPGILKNLLFPRRNVSERAVASALAKLEELDTIRTYTDDRGEKYLVLLSWYAYQSKRAKESKYPEPPENICTQMRATCTQMRASCKQVQADSEQMIPYSYSYIDKRISKNVIRSIEGSNANDDKALFDYVTGNGIKLTGRSRKMISNLVSVEGMQPGLIRLAADKAVEHGVLAWSYMEAIFNGWLSKGIHTVEEAEAETPEREIFERPGSFDPKRGYE